MLPFMREQGVEDLSAQKPAGAGRAVPGMPGDAQSQEYLTVATQDKDVRKSTILVTILFSIGLLCLWFMIKKSKPEAASAAPCEMGETQIEVAITRLTGVSSEMLGRMDKIVNKFYEFSDVFQVQVNELVKNPFELETFLRNLREKTDTQEQDIAIAAEIMRQQQLRQQQARGMQLLSIMQSDEGNYCMIDDRILHEGDSIRGFKVTQISNSFVALECNPEKESGSLQTQSQDLKIVLKLSE